MRVGRQRERRRKLDYSLLLLLLVQWNARSWDPTDRRSACSSRKDCFEFHSPVSLFCRLSHSAYEERDAKGVAKAEEERDVRDNDSLSLASESETGVYVCPRGMNPIHCVSRGEEGGRGRDCNAMTSNSASGTRPRFRAEDEEEGNSLASNKDDGQVDRRRKGWERLHRLLLVIRISDQV